MSVAVWILALSRVDGQHRLPDADHRLCRQYRPVAWSLFGEAAGLQRLIGIAVIIVARS